MIHLLLGAKAYFSGANLLLGSARVPSSKLRWLENHLIFNRKSLSSIKGSIFWPAMLVYQRVSRFFWVTGLEILARCDTRRSF